MRLRFILAAAWLSTTAWLPARSLPDWLRTAMAADTAAISQGQPAVHLADLQEAQFISESRVHLHTRAATKILTNNGRDRASCNEAYSPTLEKLLDAHAWLIGPDGKIIEEYKTSDFVDRASRSGSVAWDLGRCLTLDASRLAKIGAIFAWEIESESGTDLFDLTWSAPTDLPTALTAIEVSPLPDFELDWRGNNYFQTPTAGKLPHSLRWEARNLALPVAGTIPASVSRQPTPLSVRQRGVTQVRNTASWHQFAMFCCDIIEPQLIAASAVRAQAQTIVTGKSDRWGRIRALAEFTQRQIMYLEIQLDKDYVAGYRPHACVDVLQARYGDCKDKAGLLCTMLRSLGENAYVTLLVSGNPVAVQGDWPSAVFNHAIVAIPDDGSAPREWPHVHDDTLGDLILFDPTATDVPFGALPKVDQGGKGLVVNRTVQRVIDIPYAGPDVAVHELQFDGELLGNGAMRVRAKESLASGTDHGLRAMLDFKGATVFVGALESRLHEGVPFIEDLTWSDDGLRERNWQLSYEFKAPRFLKPTGADLIMAPLPEMWSEPTWAPWASPVDGTTWIGSLAIKKTIRLTLPTDFTIEELPDAWEKRIDDAEYHIGYRTEGAAVVCECVYRRTGRILTRSSYQQLRLFELSVQEAERRPILIRGHIAPN